MIREQPLSAPALAALARPPRLTISAFFSAPTPTSSPLLRDIVAARIAPALERATQELHLDLTPPTDARPFFFNQLRLDRLFDEDIFALPAPRRLRRQPHARP